MTEAASKIPLHEQSACAQRELAMRHRVYPGLVKRGKMTAAEAAREIDLMRAVRDTLALFAEHEDAVRAALRKSIEAERLKDHPAVQAVTDAFPDAEIVDIRDTSCMAPSDSRSASRPEGAKESASS